MTELVADAYHSLGSRDEMPDDLVVVRYLYDLKRRVGVARVGGRLYAFGDLCPCTDQPCPLSGGLLDGTTLMCQCHGSCFDIITGAVLKGPATVGLTVYEVHEVDGDVRIRTR